MNEPYEWGGQGEAGFDPAGLVEEIEVQPVHGPEQADPEEFEGGDDGDQAGQS